ncbi:blue copper protein [Phtheirospermum japonicum]|uniref:Blue copper protein n=1 Tax=Phtheirospermum japonicum TaxID=374723 RepID=A0A830DCB7_9LAMI|nr:blue copper protein [Phtheirospermum japonicum]GFQ04676.1 blue copper protein [Phtheirospermum japonicum]
MAQVRGSAHVAATAVVMMVTMAMVSHCEAASKTYIVGDTGGWVSGGMDAWLKNKEFKVGDTLVFNYPNTIHNVAEVNETVYNSCQSGSVAAHSSGHDSITLKTKGVHYFICTKPNHCKGGMKMKLTASAS